MNKLKICVVTGSRAEYGLLYRFMNIVQKDQYFDLQIIATGMHCSSEFGLTYTEIEDDGFKINKKIEMIVSADTPQSISKSTGLGLIGFADAYIDLQPDIIVVLGDRYEILSASIAALFARIPIAHIHGGETTEGAFDESLRHSITKMAWWHFVSADVHKKRVEQLGEDPRRVFLVGGLGVDCIKNSKLLSKKELEKKLNLEFAQKNLLVTFHPVTLENDTSEEHFKNVLSSLRKLKDTNIIFTYTNSDTNGRVINSMIEKFVSDNKMNSFQFTSMGRLNFLSSLQFVDGILGNSSSGLLEAPTFKIGTVNIGDRQKGRLRSKSVIDCKPTEESINKAIETLYSKDFQNNLPMVVNPYGEGNVTEKIIEVFKSTNIPENPKKEFYNL